MPGDTYITGLELGNGSVWRLAKVLRSEKQYSGPLRGLAYSVAEKTCWAALLSRGSQ